MSRVVLELKNLGLEYELFTNIFQKKKIHTVFKNINIKIYSGETFGILGKNGSGKSSLLKVISGIIPPTYGEVLNHGVTTSLLTLTSAFDSNISGRDNVLFSGMIKGFSKKYVESKMEDIRSFADIGKFFDEPLRTYSTGMRARLAFAVTSIIDPDVLLLDEILGVGDSEFKKKSSNIIKQKIKSDKTVILVSHSSQTIESFCDRHLDLGLLQR